MAGEYLLYGWGYAASKPDDWRELDTLAKSAAAALQSVYGTQYKVGAVTDYLCNYDVEIFLEYLNILFDCYASCGIRW